MDERVEIVRRSEAIATMIAPMLHGHGPEIQSIVLAELLSMWLIGHHPEVRREALEQHVGLVCDLVTVNLAKKDPWASIQ
jgi:hypothetical protein